MSRVVTVFVFALGVTLVRGPGLAHADWIPHGTGVCTASAYQTIPITTSDQAGGAVIVWRDGRTANLVYAQRMDGSGNPVWLKDGVPVFQGITSLAEPVSAISDGAGGAIIAAQSTSGVRAQRLGPTGGPLWTTSGVLIGGTPVGGALADRNGPFTVTDGAGGAIVVWKDRRSSPNYAVFAQRLDASGTALWTATGLQVGALASNLIGLDVRADGAGGAVVCWTDNAAHKLLAQRISATGALAWTAAGVQVCPGSATQYIGAISPTGAGGAIVSWMDYRSGDQDLFAQRVTAAGMLAWTATGVSICVQPGTQGPPFLQDDGSGGAILVWQDGRLGSDIGIYGQRVNSAGATQWLAGGVAAYTAPSWRQLNTLVPDGTGGVIAVWDDQRDPLKFINVYAGKISGSGVATWSSGGVALTALPEGQYNCSAATDGAGGIIGAWNDFRNTSIGMGSDIYAQRVLWDGTVTPYFWPRCVGDSEPAILTLIGSYVSPSSTVALEKSGETTLTGGPPVQVGIDTYQVTIDVTGSAQGDWTLVVDTPSYGTTTFPAPLCVEDLIVPKIVLEFLGPQAARPASALRYFAATDNTGNVTSNGYAFVSFDVPATIASVDVLFRNQLLASVTPVASPNGGSVGCFTVDRIPASGRISDYTLRFDTPATTGALGCIRAALYQVPENQGAQPGKAIAGAVRDAGIALGFTWPVPTSAFFTGSLQSQIAVKVIGLLQALAADPVTNTSLARHEELVRHAVDDALAQLATSGFATDVASYKTVWDPMKQPANWDLFRPHLEEYLAAQKLSPASLMANWPSAPFCIPLQIVASVDPNDKYGPPGPLPTHLISGLDPLPYEVHFENLATATAPAQSVTVTDPLDASRVDLGSFMFTSFGFDNRVVFPPRGLGDYTTDVDLRPARDLIVRIAARLERSSGLVTCTFTSIDPATGLPTTDPLDGFLPPNVTAPEGEGFLSFTVDAVAGLPAGTVIANQGNIVFDSNPALLTPIYSNTLENTPPTSQVLPLPASQDATSFTVTWSGSDPESGIEGYTILVSEDDAHYETWIGHTTATSGVFAGAPGHDYSFYSLARNGVGVTEAAPLGHDAITGVGGATGVVPPPFLSAWGVPGSGAGEFDQPEAVAVDRHGAVFVADFAANRIQKFTTAGAYLSQWGSAGSAAGQFNGPSGVAVDAAGMVYVTDYFNHRVQKFSGAGVFVTSWGGPGTGDGQLDRPDGVAISPSGTVYVADSYNHRVQRFSSSGAFLGKWGGRGSGQGQMLNPAGVAVDAQGDVYVSDANNHRIQKFTSDGSFLTAWGTFGSGPGQFDTPQGIATDVTDNLYVTDFFNNRVQEFTPQGAFVTQWGSPGAGPGQFDTPTDVAVDDLFHVFVADLGNHRVQKFGRGLLADRAPYIPATLTFSVSPNPARTARLSFDLPKEADVELSVLDLQGRRVATMFQGVLPAGRYTKEWSGMTSSGTSAAPGIYFYRIRADGVARVLRGVRIP